MTDMSEISEISGFTPGPWQLCYHLESSEQDKKCGCGYRGGVWSGDGETIICEMGAMPEQDGTKLIPEAPRERQLIDARLIAAAPDMHAEIARLCREKAAAVEALRIVDEEIRHHLRSDENAASLIRRHAVLAVRAAIHSATENGK